MDIISLKLDERLPFKLKHAQIGQVSSFNSLAAPDCVLQSPLMPVMGWKKAVWHSETGYARIACVLINFAGVVLPWKMDPTLSMLSRGLHTEACKLLWVIHDLVVI